MSVCISFFFFSPHSHLVSPPLCPCRLPLTRLLFSFAERFVLVRVVLCWVFLFFWYSVWFVGSGLLCVSWCARVYFNVYTFLQFYVCCLALRLYIYMYISLAICVHTHTNALHHVFALPLRICLSCALLTSCVANVQFGFLTHASRRVLIHTSAIFILPQLSDNDTLNTHEYSLTVCMSSFWILVGWHWCN